MQDRTWLFLMIPEYQITPYVLKVLKVWDPDIELKTDPELNSSKDGIHILSFQSVDNGGYDVLDEMCSKGVDFIATHGNGLEFDAHMILSYNRNFVERKIGNNGGEFIVQSKTLNGKLQLSETDLQNLQEFYDLYNRLLKDWRQYNIIYRTIERKLTCS